MDSSASSEYSSAYAAYKVTTTNDWVPTQGQQTNFWVQIQAPASGPFVIPAQIALRGRLADPAEVIQTWKFDASNDGVNYTTLLTSSTPLTGTANLYFSVTSATVAYRYFRLFALTTNSPFTAGLSVFQVYYNSLSGLKYLAVNGSNMMTANLNMNTNLINNVGTPVAATDAVNKQYVDTAVVKQKCRNGLFPFITADTSKTGYIASASSEFSASFLAANVTSPYENADWATNGVTSNFWIQVLVPQYSSSLGGAEPWAFMLNGKQTSSSTTIDNLTSWRFDCSSDLVNYTTLYTSTTAVTGNNPVLYQVNTNGVTFRAFRIYATSGNGVNPGLSLFQVYYYV